MIRLERVNLKKVHSVAKVIGTGITVGGAMIMTLYRGPIVEFFKSGGVSHHAAAATTTSDGSSDQHWVTGTLMLLASCCSWAGYFILQVIIHF